MHAYKGPSWTQMLAFYLVATSCLKSTVKATTNVTISFHRDNFAVIFGPYVANRDMGNPYAYDEQSMLPMVNLIATKFSKIMTTYISNFYDWSAFLVPITVAHWNMKNGALLPLEAFVTCGGDDENYRSNTSNLTLFDVAVSILERANNIYPGTVKSVILDRAGYQRSNDDGLLSQLAEANRSLAKIPTGNRYRLGLTLGWNTCREGGRTMPPFLDQIELIIFPVYLSQRAKEFRVDKIVDVLTNGFDDCKKIIHKLNPGIEVAFKTRWQDGDDDGRRNFSNLVSFWRGMNAWAMRSNTTVFMFEAFDEPNRPAPGDTAGWWRLKNSNDAQIITPSDEYEFEDKAEAALRQEKGVTHTFQLHPGATETGTGAGSSSNATGGNTLVKGVGSPLTVAISVIAAFLSFGMMLAGMIFLYKKVSRVENRQQSVLTREDIREFLEGNRKTKEGTHAEIQEEGSSGILGTLQLTAYDNKHELPLSSFTIDVASPLGMGAFGLVCRGTISQASVVTAVAVKMLKQPSPATALKGLLSEIKVMSHSGAHENLVCLVGAYTKELKKGKVYVFTELCSLGSLEKYLREHKPQQLQESLNEQSYLLLEESQAVYVNSKRVGQVDSNDLYRWSYQIANGLEFLATKHVVHADLATRNVLLTADMTAKISDFGLSRRMYDYTNYVKTQQEPLPWRWMAPESLRRFQFNEKTDVWSFGVTLWEIYSLGDVPYPGLSWTLDFSTRLENGLRLEKPEHNADGMYVTMLKCWNIDPTKRPTFHELRKSLQK